MSIFKKLDFTNNKTILFEDTFYLPVPKGYHFSEDKDIIGERRKLAIVPNDYDLYDDPMPIT